MSRTAWHNPSRRVLGQLRYAGMRWELEGGALYLTGTTDALTDAHRAAIDRHRPQLVTILEALPTRCVVPHLCCVIGPCDPARCRQAEPQQEYDTDTTGCGPEPPAGRPQSACKPQAGRDRAA